AYNTALHFTSNGGQTWQQQTGINGFIMGIEVDPVTPSKYYVAIGGFSQGQKVMMVSNGVVSNITGTGLPNVPCNSLVYQRGTPNRLFAGTDIGVFFMDEGTGFWQSYGSGLPPVIVTGLRLIPSSSLLRISTYGRGIWEIDVTQCAAATPTITAATPTTICAGDSVVLEAATGYSSYRWSNGDTTRRVVLNNASQSGAYLVGVEDSKGCRATSTSINVVINRLPSKPLVTKIARDTLRSSAFGGVTKYQWFRDGVEISGATSRNLPVTQSGSYLVKVFDATCSNTSDEFAYTYEPAVSVIDDNGSGWQIAVTPNPVDESFVISLPGTSMATLVVMDITGRTVFETTSQSMSTSMRVNAGTWTPGMYLAQIRAGSGVWTVSFVKN
ncbi:MAG: T9SS type A sorting domain-containing protein, partial [Candidatus Kapabacteria bacterium]|nr:T9SS type A sorting domain-containing protein [Candidatus Kapabacteria bacterium]